MSEIGKDKLTLCDGWPDRYQERTAFTPHCRAPLPEGVVASYHQVLGGHGQDSAIMPVEELGL